MKTRNPGL